MIIEFDKPESVMTSDIITYMETAVLDEAFEPPIPFDVFAKALRANPMHSSALDVKKNMAMTSLNIMQKDIISRKELKKFIVDYLVFGNGYLKILSNALGQVGKLEHIPALYMRRHENLKDFVYKPTANSDDNLVLKEHQIFHLYDYDVSQEIYGLPQYVSALTSIWLSEDATLFRRKYFINGSHAGYLMYIDDPNMGAEQEEQLKMQLKNRGALAFKNLFFNGRGKGKKPELIPISQAEAKDSYKDIKQQTMADILTCHRIPLELMSVKREGIQSSGDLNKIDKVFYKNELVPLLESIVELNDFIGRDILAIQEYKEL